MGIGPGQDPAHFFGRYRPHDGGRQGPIIGGDIVDMELPAGLPDRKTICRKEGR
jgi:hypothetical protein